MGQVAQVARPLATGWIRVTRVFYQKFAMMFLKVTISDKKTPHILSFSFHMTLFVLVTKRDV